MMKSNRRASVGFTLIELLVVMAIFAILASLLRPALRSAFDKAVTMQCGSNVKQLCMANSWFAEDHRGWAVPARWLSPSGVNQSWFWNEHFYIKIKDLPCGAQTPTEGPGTRRSDVSGGYGQTDPAWTFKNGSQWEGWKLTLATTPSRTAVFGDAVAGLICYPQGGTSHDEWRLKGENSLKWCYSRVAYRHQHGVNLGFFDGHVEWRHWIDASNTTALTPALKPADWNILWNPYHSTNINPIGICPRTNASAWYRND